MLYLYFYKLPFKLLITLGIYRYLIKYQAKKKHLPFCDSKLKQFCVGSIN